MKTACIDCGKKTQAYPRCSQCKALVLNMYKNAKTWGWTIDLAGGAWWVWDQVGNVLAMHEKSRTAALRLPVESTCI